jgi:hypothetical protein
MPEVRGTNGQLVTGFGRPAGWPIPTWEVRHYVTLVLPGPTEPGGANNIIFQKRAHAANITAARQEARLGFKVLCTIPPHLANQTFKDLLPGLQAACEVMAEGAQDYRPRVVHMAPSLVPCQMRAGMLRGAACPLCPPAAADGKLSGL